MQEPVKVDVPALAMEEATPQHVSDASMLAPQEQYDGRKFEEKAEEELTKEDRKRRRAAKKRRAAARDLQMESEGKKPKHKQAREEAERLKSVKQADYSVDE